MPKPEEPVADPVDEEPKVPPEQPGEAQLEETPDVLPPEETPAEPPAELGEAEPEAPAEPSADELKQRLAAAEAENERLKAGQPAAAPTPGERVSMAQVFLNTHVPADRKAFAESKDPARQYEIVLDSANKLVGAVLHDQVTPAIQQLAAANVELMNEVEILTLRSDPDFKVVEPQVRAQLKKTDWKARATFNEDGSGAVAEIFYRLRGSRKNGAPKLPPKSTPADAARRSLKDLAAGGGASPKPAGIRLTPEQEKDFQAMVESGWPGSRADYYAKWKARSDQAKAQNKPIPKTYRGYS